MAKILVTAKVNPDLDGTSCALAYAELLKRNGQDAQGLVTGEPQSEVQYFIQKQNITIPTREDTMDDKWENFILVDASAMKGMPKVVKADKIVEIIDHRTGEPEKEFPNAKIQNELIGAAATIVVERYTQAGLKPLPEHAKLLYGAIYHNTLNFIATNATDRDREAAKFLKESFSLSESLVKEMFDFATQKIEENIRMAIINDSKEFGDGYSVRAYQLIVWGDSIVKQKPEIEKVISDLEREFQAVWSFINIIDLESKQSIIYASNEKAIAVLSKALGSQFEDGWAVLPKAMLRKQIMPKVHEVLEHEKV